MQRIVITGGCGFIGVNLIDYLKQNDNRSTIVVLDNETLGKRAYLDEFDVEFIHGDIKDGELVDKVFKNTDAIVHLAADTRVLDSIADPTKNFENNVIGTFNILNAVRKHSIPVLINASTGGAILGEVEPPVHENMVPAPISPYGASKLAVEGYCTAFNGSYGIRTSSLRFSNVYGPRSFHKGSVVASFFKNILARQPLDVYGDGSQVRDYVFVADVCQGICRALQMQLTGVFQLGTGVPVSINQLIDLIKKVVIDAADIEVRYHAFRKGEIHSTYCDISRARKVINYHPAVNLKRGLKLTWDWFKVNFG